MANLSYKLCRLIKMILLYTSGTPYMDPQSETAKSIRRKADLDLYELQQYREVWKQNWWSMAAIVLWTLYLDIKYVFFIGLTLSSADHSDPEKNIKIVPTKDGSFQFRFNCLMSNCSKPLSGPKSQGLGYDFKQVPHIWLCHPELVASRQFSPWDLLDTRTLLNQTSLIIFITIAGFIYPIFQAAYASPNEALMFILAPKATTSLVCDKLINLYQDLNLSYLNFRSVSIQLQQERCGGKNEQSSARHQQLGCANSSQLQLQLYARDCLPATRLAYWWRSQAAHIMSSTFVIMTLFCIVVEAFYTLVTLSAVDQHKSLMDSYAREVAHQGCAIWFAQTSEFVDLEKPIMDYNLFNVIEYSNFFTSIALILSSILSFFLLIVLELNFWIRELEVKLIIAIEILRLQDIIHSSSIDSCPTHKGMQFRKIKFQRSKFNLAQIRNELIKSSRLNSIGFVSFDLENFAPAQFALTKESKKFGHRMYALKLLQKQAPGAHIECIEKVYLSFRLFMDLVEQYGRLTAPLILFTNILTYSFAAIGVFYTLNIRDLTFEALILAFSLMLTVVILILIGAAFHSNAMRLSILVWSLMAQITRHTNDPKLAHLLFLWSKLQSMINNEGGIFLKALGMRFDYFKIVQLTVGASTIMMLAMKD